jgi:uncharacterized protein (PEP-CTERM system associated)
MKRSTQSVLFIAAMPMFAAAQTWTPGAIIKANITATNNAALAANPQKRADLITTVQPEFQLAGRGVSFKLDARVGLDASDYARTTQKAHVAPVVEVNAATTLAPNWLFLDAAASLREAETDPYGPRLDNGTDKKRTASYRISPYLSHKATPNLEFLARWDESWTRTDGFDEQRFSKLQLRAEHQPTPLGGWVEYLRQDTRFSDSSRADSNRADSARWLLETYQAAVALALTDELAVGPVVGQERSKLLLQNNTESLYGLHLRWVPSVRTELVAQLDHRFFGTGWNVNLRHRSPTTSLVVQSGRLPVSSVSALGNTASRDLNEFLDAIFTTRYPDAAQRTTLVNELVTSRGLRTDVPGSLDVLTNAVQLQTYLNATWMLVGTRNTLTLSAYGQTRRQLLRAGDVLGSLGGSDADNRQMGATVNLNRKLSPQLSVDVASSWSRIQGLGARSADLTDEQNYRLAMTRAQSLRTGVSAGIQYNKFRTTVFGLNPYAATSAFVGLSHRF